MLKRMVGFLKGSEGIKPTYGRGLVLSGPGLYGKKLTHTDKISRCWGSRCQLCLVQHRMISRHVQLVNDLPQCSTFCAGLMSESEWFLFYQSCLPIATPHFPVSSIVLLRGSLDTRWPHLPSYVHPKNEENSSVYSLIVLLHSPGRSNVRCFSPRRTVYD